MAVGGGGGGVRGGTGGMTVGGRGGDGVALGDGADDISSHKFKKKLSPRSRKWRMMKKRGKDMYVTATT